MPTSQGRSSAGAASMGGLASGRMVPAANQHRAGARAGLAGEVDRIAHGHPAALEGLDQLGVALGGHDRDDLRVVAGRERTERGGELRVAAQGARGGGAGRAARRDQAAAEDDDARPLPFLESTADVA